MIFKSRVTPLTALLLINTIINCPSLENETHFTTMTWDSVTNYQELGRI